MTEEETERLEFLTAYEALGPGLTYIEMVELADLRLKLHSIAFDDIDAGDDDDDDGFIDALIAAFINPELRNNIMEIYSDGHYHT